MFISDTNLNSGRTLIIDEDDNVCMAYVTKSQDKDFDCEGWLYNRIPHPERSELDAYAGTPVPAPVEYLKEGTPIFAGMEEGRISWKWSLDGEKVGVYLDGRLLALLCANTGDFYNAFLNQECPWGKTIVLS